jgi:hypothetical protein
MSIVALFLSISQQATSQTLFLEGTLLDSASAEPVVGAAMRVLANDAGRSTGTYSTAKGWFRLPITSLPATIRISVLGYKPLEYKLDSTFAAKSKPITLRLAPAPVQLGAVEVRALTAEEIIRRASAARRANAGSLNSVTTTLYTKINGVGRVKMPFRAEETQSAIAETIARIEETYKPKREMKTTILQRRQTANILAQSNIFTFNEFFNFLADEVKIFKARLTTPLSSHALNAYTYEIIGQQSFGNNQTAFVMSFKPRSPAFPGFEGRLVIANESFALMEADFRPTKTDMTVAESLSYKQKFSEYSIDAASGQTVWIPTYLQMKLTLSLQAMAGLARGSGEITAQSIAQDVRVRADAQALASATAAATASTMASTSVAAPKAASEPATQTVSKPKKLPRKTRTVTVEPSADSTKTEFWQKNSLYELSPEELATYRHVDSIQQAKIAEEKANPAKAASQVTSQGKSRRRSGGNGVSFRMNLSLGSEDENDESESADTGFDAEASIGQATDATPTQSGMAAFRTGALVPLTLSSNATLGINPIVNRTRTTSWILGAELLPEFFDSEGQSVVALSLRASTDLNPARDGAEQRRLWGEASARAVLLRWNDSNDVNIGTLYGFGGVFTRLNALQDRRFTAPMLTPFNLNLDYLLYDNRFDYYREDGWNAGLAMNTGLFYMSLVHTQASNFRLRTTVERERENIPMTNGRFRTWRVDAGWNYANPLVPLTPLGTEPAQFGAKISAEIGERGELSGDAERGTSFAKAELGVFAVLPTFATGYERMALMLTGSAGMASTATPVQKQFVMMRRYEFLGAMNDLLSPVVNAFGGTQFVQIRAEHTFSDLPWRALGLPTWRARGVELSIFGAAAWYGNSSETASILTPTPSGNPFGTPYAELGFSVSRIPLFLIDFLYARFDTGWGVGAIGTGRFGFSFGAYFAL